jgi:hypothetical protein
MKTEQHTTKATHTPGPWKLEAEKDGQVGISRPGYWRNFAVAYTSNPSIEPGQGHANARLIAAAPTLLEALELLTRETPLHALNIRKDFSLINAHANACAAIREAKGHQ